MRESAGVARKRAEADLRSSREAKRRRTGVCEDCGGVTRYGGQKDAAVSRLCVSCSARRVNGRRRGTGPTQARILAFVGDGERRFMEIVAACGLGKGPGCSHLHRLLKLGLLERPRRGVYRKPTA
ncbi:MAG: hypothetical protein ACJ780_28620 [Solirubrobacteraceae bacterium]